VLLLVVHGGGEALLGVAHRRRRVHQIDHVVVVVVVGVVVVVVLVLDVVSGRIGLVGRPAGGQRRCKLGVVGQRLVLGVALAELRGRRRLRRRITPPHERLHRRHVRLAERARLHAALLLVLLRQLRGQLLVEHPLPVQSLLQLRDARVNSRHLLVTRADRVALLAQLGALLLVQLVAKLPT